MYVTSQKDAGKRLAEVHRYLGNVDLRLSSATADTILGAGIDLAFCALPHGTSMSLIRRLVDGGARLVDVGADFRFTDRSTYERHYGPHEEPGLMEEAVYGLTEHARERVRGARLVGNPGCYPTGALMGLIPIAGLLEGTVFVDSKSGTSGAGRAAAMNQLFAEVTENLRPYGVWSHRHQPEIEEKVREAGGAHAGIRFAPSLLPIARGLVSACYVTSRRCEEVGERLRNAYANEPFVRCCPRVFGRNLGTVGIAYFLGPS